MCNHNIYINLKSKFGNNAGELILPVSNKTLDQMNSYLNARQVIVIRAGKITREIRNGLNWDEIVILLFPNGKFHVFRRGNSCGCEKAFIKYKHCRLFITSEDKKLYFPSFINIPVTRRSEAHIKSNNLSCFC